MSQDDLDTGGEDLQRIDIHDDYALTDWAHSLNTTCRRIVQAVQAVGDRAADVDRWIDRH